MKRGIWSAIGAYTLWGLFPVYFKWLAQVPALELIGHRIVWSCLMLCGVIVVRRQWRAFREHALQLGVIRAYVVAAVLISGNWLVYVWAVNSGYIIEASLGYFINPLISVLMAVVLLHERLRPWQWVSVSLAVLGVVYLTFIHGSLPWIALTLAFTFAFYGLIKKKSPLGALFGLTLETGILLLPALVYLLVLEGDGRGAFHHSGTLIDTLLIGCGLVTAIPLLLFASAAQRIPLALLGVLQYIGPTLQFLIAILIYHEPFALNKLIGFAIIWTALLIFAIEGFFARRAQAEPLPEPL